MKPNPETRTEPARLPAPPGRAGPAQPGSPASVGHWFPSLAAKRVPGPTRARQARSWSPFLQPSQGHLRVTGRFGGSLWTMMPHRSFLPWGFLHSTLNRPPSGASPACLLPFEGAVPSLLSPRPSCREPPALVPRPAPWRPHPVWLPHLSAAHALPPPLCLRFHCPRLANPRHTRSCPPVSWSAALLTVQMATVTPRPSLDGRPCSLLKPLPPAPRPPPQRTQEPPHGQPRVASPNPKPASLTPTSFHPYRSLCQPPLCLLLSLFLSRDPGHQR